MRITESQRLNKCNCYYCCSESSRKSSYHVSTCIYCCSDSHSKFNANCSDSYPNYSHNRADKTCKLISNLLLPQDLFFYIFTLLPLTYLLNSARYVCKSWATTINSSHFVEMCERRARSKLGLYVEDRTTQGSSYFLEYKDDVNGQFQRSNLGIPNEKLGYIISTCDGILLLSSNCGRIFVVNPIIKRWLRIPPVPISQCRRRVLVSSQSAIARVPRTEKFKLFFLDVLEISGAFWHVFYVLRIGIDNSWKEIARKEARRNRRFPWQSLYSGGNDLYWITNDEVIVMDVDREIIVREYPLPTMLMPVGKVPGFLLMGNHLSCIVYKDKINEAYQIYILDFDSGKWSPYHEMGHFDYVAACCGHKLKKISLLFCLWINDQIIFRVTFPGRDSIFRSERTPISTHFCYDVKTRQLTMIKGIDVGDFKVWLHTNSRVTWPSTPT